MNKDTYALFKQVKRSIDMLDIAYLHIQQLDDQHSYEGLDMKEINNMLDFRKHQLVSRMKFLITQLEKE